MALMATVTTNFISKGTTGTYKVSMKLILEDDFVVVLDMDVLQVHNSGNNISVARDAILEKMQNAIDEYKNNKELSNSAALISAVEYINNNLEI